MKRNRTNILILLIVFLCSGGKLAAQLHITPKPLVEELQKGTFILNKKTVLYTNLKDEERNNMLNFLKESPLKLFKIGKSGKKNSVNLLLVEKTADYPSAESYQLSITPKQIIISATDGAGLFYGVQSLLQLVNQDEGLKTKVLPAALVKDTPRFSYRGLHLDVSRHFFTKNFIKKQLDMMAYYKLNRFHWHLTDGAGWRIEIKKYPLLTDSAAWRPYKTWKEWHRNGRKYCTKNNPKAEGGYYTQEDIKEVVAYAQSRFITVIPEIEMPGHSEEVLAVYPELSCSGKPYVDSDFCIGNDSTFTFLENVLTEVMALFPSKYIHIGGDEARKKGWKTCAKCQARMTNENLKNVDELQSYMIHRIENFLNANGRKLLGWDEILQGGLAPDATVMSWRGEQGGIDAVKSGHQAIMTPGSHCYIDGYQDAPYSQPEAIGGYLPLEKVYSYNPIPASLTPDEAKLIYGVQANLWAEYIQTDEHCEYMIYPRILALAEVAWSAPERKSWTDFRPRALKAVAYLQSKGYHPFDLKKEIGNRPEASKPVQHLALGKTVKYNAPYNASYPAQGDKTLTDGIRGSWTYSDGVWQGFISRDRLDVTIDMGESTVLHSIGADFMQVVGPEVFLPTEVIISVSEDGKNFTELSRQTHKVVKSDAVVFKNYAWNGEAKGRYIRYQARAGEEFGGWVFTDEIVVE